MSRQIGRHFERRFSDASGGVTIIITPEYDEVKFRLHEGDDVPMWSSISLSEFEAFLRDYREAMAE